MVDCVDYNKLTAIVTNWRGIVEKDLRGMGLTWEEVEVAALNRQVQRWLTVFIITLLAICSPFHCRLADYRLVTVALMHAHNRGSVGCLVRQ